MIPWDANPVAFSLGPLAVRWYGLIYALGFLLGYWVLRKAARHKLIPNLTERLAEDYILLLMLGSIIMARLAQVIIYDPSYYARNLLEIPAVWHGGLSIHGGLLGAIIVTAYFCKKHNIKFYHIADIAVVPLALAFTFGKIANFANAELYGTKTDAPWCVVFPDIDGCRHPMQLYEALYGYALFVILLVMQESKRFADGVIFWSYILFYGLFRFIVNFWRVPEQGEAVFFSISTGQWLSLLLVFTALAWFGMMIGSRRPLVRRAKA